MGYSYTQSAFDSVKIVLDQLLDGGRHEIPAENPNYMAFLIRQGIAAAEHLNIEPYNTLTYRFRTRPGLVLCEPKKKPTVKATTTVSRVSRINARKGHFEVVVSLTQAANDVEEIIFENFTGDPEKVTAWASQNNWEVLDTTPLHLARVEDEDV